MTKLIVSEVVKHHLRRPDLTDRIGKTFACDIGSRPVDRLEHGWVAAFEVDVRRRGDADAAHDGGAHIGEDVAEQIACDNDIELGRLRDEEGGKGVDVIRLYVISGKLPRH